MILNEPSVMAFQGHLEGSHAPGMKDRKAYAACAHHQNMVIGNTYSVLKARNPKWTVGSAYTHFPIRAITDTPENQKARVMMDAIWNRSFYDPLFKGTYPDVLAQDFAPFIKAGDIEIIRKPIDFNRHPALLPVLCAVPARHVAGSGICGTACRFESDRHGLGRRSRRFP
jgi:beta-glucosidase